MTVKTRGLEQPKGMVTYGANKFRTEKRMNAKNKEIDQSTDEKMHDSFKSWINKLLHVERRRLELSKAGASQDFHEFAIKRPIVITKRHV